MEKSSNMNESSDNEKLLDEIHQLAVNIGQQQADPERRSLAEFRLMFNELEILDEVDATLAQEYVTGHGILASFMRDPLVCFPYLRMSIQEILDHGTIHDFTREELISCVQRLIYMIYCKDQIEPVGHFDMPPQPQPKQRPAAARPIVPTPPPMNDRMKDFLHRLKAKPNMAPEDTAERMHLMEAEGMNPTQEGERSLTVQEMAQVFNEVSKIQVVEDTDPDPRFENLPIDPEFDNYPALGEPEALIPDNPNKKPLFIIPDANEVKQYAAPHSGNKGPVVDDNGLGNGPKRNPAKRRRSSPKDGQQDNG